MSGLPNSWWRSTTGERLIHFCCGVCYKERTIPKAWEWQSIPELRLRAWTIEQNLLICDACWPVVRERCVGQIQGKPCHNDYLLVPSESEPKNYKLPPYVVLPGVHPQ